jgi:hypothetical protein
MLDTVARCDGRCRLPDDRYSRVTTLTAGHPLSMARPDCRTMDWLQALRRRPTAIQDSGHHRATGFARACSTHAVPVAGRSP